MRLKSLGVVILTLIFSVNLGCSGGSGQGAGSAASKPAPLSKGGKGGIKPDSPPLQFDPPQR